MHFRFLQFPRGSQDWSLSDSELERSIPDLALVIQPIPLSEARNGNAYVRVLPQSMEIHQNFPPLQIFRPYLATCLGTKIF